ncbi:hypothetical protein L208DRAFT_1376199 [Tricholoma matsutake]|nr:hypothetical protein L208DRAFT_1376199 [Tricholoma matsutake 945]
MEESQADPAPAHPLVLAGDRAISKVARDKAHCDETQEEDEDVQWLKSKAEMSEEQRMHEILGICGGVFKGSCLELCSLIPMNLQGQKKIKKKAIMAALGLHTTTLAEAEHATKIILMFGNEGSWHSQEVVDMLEKEEVQ